MSSIRISMLVEISSRLITKWVLIEYFNISGNVFILFCGGELNDKINTIIISFF